MSIAHQSPLFSGKSVLAANMVLSPSRALAESVRLLPLLSKVITGTQSQATSSLCKSKNFPPNGSPTLRAHNVTSQSFFYLKKLSILIAFNSFPSSAAFASPSYIRSSRMLLRRTSSSWMTPRRRMITPNREHSDLRLPQRKSIHPSYVHRFKCQEHEEFMIFSLFSLTLTIRSS